MSVLNELYYGNINPSARTIRKGSAYQKCNSELSDCIEKLLPLLNDTQKAMCEQISNKMSDLNCLAEKDSFVHGFCLGAQVMLEIIHWKSDDFSSLCDQ